MWGAVCALENGFSQGKPWLHLGSAAPWPLLGVLVSPFITGPPLRYSEFNSLVTGFLISLAVGIAAAGLAPVDDVYESVGFSMCPNLSG